MGALAAGVTTSAEPNFLFIITDDQDTYSIGAYRNSEPAELMADGSLYVVDTPNIDRVAKEGVLFETCIAQTPLTLPSHTSILSGTYPLHHQIRDNGGFLVPDSLEFVSEIVQKQ